MKFIILVLTTIASQTFAQKQNSVWVFGDSAGINFINIGNPTPISSGMRGRGSCVSYCDTMGSLKIYAFTVESTGFVSTHLFNSNHTSIPGVDSVAGCCWYNELGLFPKPGDTTGNLFYVFSNSVGTAPNSGMYYTLVDMSLNNGFGGLVLENIQLDNNSYGDCLTTIKHGNGRDWWVISKWTTFAITQQNRFFVYLCSPDTILGPTVQDLGNTADGDFVKIIWHHTQDKFMLINTLGFMAEYDFDRCSGIITLNRIIYSQQSSNFNRLFWGGAYSTNGDIFYTSRTSYGGNFGDYNYLLQYDLTAIDIPASCDTLDSTLYPIADCGDLRLAPDGKIYYSQAYPHGFPYQDTMRNYVNENLGVINNPDVVGPGCNFAPFSFYLGGKRTYYGLPNNPNYSLGPLIGSPCDTLTVDIVEKQKNAGVFISPNPATSTIYFNAQNLKGKQGILNIVSVNGERVFQKPVEILNGGYATLRIDVNYYPSGIYFVSFQTERESVSGKFVKE